MADGNLIDLFRDKHREYLHSMDRVWVSYDSGSDRLELSFRCSMAAPPINWLRQLTIVLFHEQYGLQDSFRDLEWIDVGGSQLTATCPRSKILFPDGDPSLLSDLVPIGDVVIFSGKDEYEYPLYNEFGQRVMSRKYDPYYAQHRLPDRDPYSSG